MAMNTNEGGFYYSSICEETMSAYANHYSMDKNYQALVQYVDDGSGPLSSPPPDKYIKYPPVKNKYPAGPASIPCRHAAPGGGSSKNDTLGLQQIADIIATAGKSPVQQPQVAAQAAPSGCEHELHGPTLAALTKLGEVAPQLCTDAQECWKKFNKLMAAAIASKAASGQVATAVAMANGKPFASSSQDLVLAAGGGAVKLELAKQFLQTWANFPALFTGISCPAMNVE